ncbi:hypothetical protein [Massilia sp. 9096]|uniref:hypothetical protein n=1 Tax=Massilia sp. 9096 TaxID=1500894 RepID=UPI000564CA66|nr:hypothetical protein [Massilia sp. 9096]
MKTNYDMRAVRLLAEDARLRPLTRHVLVTLVWATPVALRGHATMIPLSELLRRLNTEADDPWRGTAEPEVLSAIDELDEAHWSMPSLEGAAIGSFLNGHTLSEASGLLHFQIDNNLIAALDQISQQLQADSDGPPETRH